MTTTYKFVRVKSGITAFAGIELSTEPAQRPRISWLDTAAEARAIYGAAVEAGLQAALDAHDSAGGAPQAVLIHQLITSTSDTKPDAVQCAAALGLWKTLGHQETTADTEFVGGTWTVTFR